MKRLILTLLTLTTLSSVFADSVYREKVNGKWQHRKATIEDVRAVKSITVSKDYIHFELEPINNQQRAKIQTNLATKEDKEIYKALKAMSASK